MKRILRVCFCYAIISKVTLYADFEQSNFTFHSHSLHLFSNPSIISTQHGIPFSAVFFPSGEEKNEAAAAVSFILEKNAFAVGYERNEIYNNRIISGYSFKKEFFFFGPSFSFLIDSTKDPNLLLDVASTIQLPRSRYISLVLKNIIGTEKIRRSMPPNGRLSFFGGFPGIEDVLGFDISYYSNFNDLSKGRINHGAKLNIAGTFLKSPMIYYSTGYDLNREKKSIINHFIYGKLGLQLRINEISAGLSYGVRYDINSSDYKMHLQVNFNPTTFQHNHKLQINLNIKKSYEKNSGVYVSFDYIDLFKSATVKKWVLVISKLPSSDGEIIKSFSGGNLPPSSIYWNFKDVSGKYYDQEVIYIRGIITDNSNNLAVTPWITFDPKK